MNEEVWVSLVVWIFLVLAGLRYREFYILAFSGLIGFILSVLILSLGWTLLGLGLLCVNLYLMYQSLVNW